MNWIRKKALSNGVSNELLNITWNEMSNEMRKQNDETNVLHNMKQNLKKNVEQIFKRNGERHVEMKRCGIEKGRKLQTKCQTEYHKKLRHMETIPQPSQNILILLSSRFETMPSFCRRVVLTTSTLDFYWYNRGSRQWYSKFFLTIATLVRSWETFFHYALGVIFQCWFQSLLLQLKKNYQIYPKILYFLTKLFSSNFFIWC